MSAPSVPRKPRARKLVIKENPEPKPDAEITVETIVPEVKEEKNVKINPVPRKNKHQSIYLQSLLTRRIILPYAKVGKQLRTTLQKIISSRFEGKCGPEGFIRPGSTKIMTHSTGLLSAGKVQFVVGFECLVCNPVEGMHIKCIAKNITKAGIRAEIDDLVSPVVVFVARDHHFASAAFNEIKEGDQIVVRVIGQRFELNDKYVSIIGQFLEKKTKYTTVKPNN